MSENDFNIQRSLRKVRALIIYVASFCALLLLGLLIFVPIDERISASGRIRAERDSYLFSPADGLLEKVHADIGETVSAGDPVITLDTTDLQAQLSRLLAQIELAQAELDLEKAHLETTLKLPLPKDFWHVQEEMTAAIEKLRQSEIELERSVSLHGKGLISTQELERDRLNLEMAKGEEKKVAEKLRVLNEGFKDSLLNQATARYRTEVSELKALRTEERILQEQIARHTIRAPYDGVVTLLLKVRPGEKVGKGEKLVHVSHGEPDRVDLFVGETQIHRLRPGQYVRMQSSSFDSLRFGYIEGEVVEVPQEPEDSQSSGGMPIASVYRVKAQVKKTPQPLVIGSTVDARITLQRSPLWHLLLPVRDLESPLETVPTADNQRK